ncbi:hypothetical protein Dcar01_02387 [Deinococcus carri]|uniref:Helix-hairpin-helix domain-containing protein n=1 Tax=Deinococcus carri TaxID=1211323 RepID=A0ABP9W8H0_9DEIO
MTQPPIPESLKRVAVREDPTQEEAARITVDYSGGMDVAHLTLNPDVAPPESVDGYRIRAAVAATLEPLRRYNRAITRRYGTWDNEQALFDDGMAKAAAEVEQLVHLAPRSPESLLDALRGLSDEQLLAVPGLGARKLEYLRKALA